MLSEEIIKTYSHNEKLGIARLIYAENKANVESTRKLLQINMADEELVDHINLYPKWNNIPVNTFIEELTYLQYKDKLYQCRKGKGHNKQANWNPKDAVSEFEEVGVAKDVIPAWESGKGYSIGDKVTHQGFIWTSKVAGNIAEPSDDSGFYRYWEQGDEV